MRLVAGLFPLDVLADLISIGILLAFAVVCAGVLILRYTRPDHPRPFRVPFAHGDLHARHGPVSRDELFPVRWHLDPAR